MEKFLKEYNNKIPDDLIQAIIKEQMKIISKIKSHESISEEIYIEDFKLEYPNMTVKETEMWQEVIHESFRCGIFYYITQTEHNSYDGRDD